MKAVKDKYLVVGADFAGFPLKEVVVEHLTKKGWKILEAHKDPFKYPDLVVRVTGFTAYFAMLSPEFR